MKESYHRMPRQLLIDGHSLLFRAFHALPPLTARDGTPTGAMYGFLNMLLRVVDEEHPDRIIVAFDGAWATFRHEQYAEYKAGRVQAPDEFRQQVPLVQELLSGLGIPVLMAPGFEADDVIGTLARQGEDRQYVTLILSGDRDLLQLVNGNTTVLLMSRLGISDLDRMTPSAVREKMGVDPAQIPDLKGLEGDSSDNIRGVAGIGKKSAQALLTEYGTVEKIIENIEAINNARWQRALRGQEEVARTCRDLATIVTDVPLDWPEVEEPHKLVVSPEAAALLTRLDLHAVHRRLGGILQESSPQSTPHAGERLTPYDEQPISALQDDRTYLLWVDSSDMLWIADPIDQWVGKYSGEKLSSAPVLVWGAKRLYRYCYRHQLTPPECREDGELQAYLLESDRRQYDVVSLAQDQGFAVENTVPELMHAMNTLIGRQGELIQSLGLEEVYRTVELPLAKVLAQMEEDGIRVDSQKLHELGEELAQMISALEQEIFDMAGQVFNINSPHQLGDILFGRLGLPTMKKTKTGFSTDADTLEALAPLHPIVEKVLNYRQVIKIKGTYVDGMLPLVQKDHRLHTTFHQTVTGTGRLSSSDPNLQNIPIRGSLGRRVRGVFIPTDGRVLMAADYSQIELRLLAHLSGDDNLIQAFWDGEDIHARTAAEIFNITGDVDPVWRARAKAVNFGIIYGISDFGLARDTGVSRNEAKDYIARYYARYPRLKQYFDGVIEEARQAGEVRTVLGRRRVLNDISAKNRARRQYAERMAINTVIQGSAADLIKIAMVRVSQELTNPGWVSQMILQVHDELIWDVVPRELDALEKVARQQMTQAMTLKVPLVVEVKVGPAWDNLDPRPATEG